jgi:hypothetical protein
MSDHRNLGIAGGIAAFVVLILLFATGHFSTNSNGSMASASPTTTPLSGCAVTASYYAAQAPAGSNFFGPAVTQTSVAGQLAELHNRRCADPALVVAQSKYEGLPGYVNLTGAQLTAEANALAGNPTQWMQAIKNLESNESGKLDVDTTKSGSYQTMYMVVQPSGAPLIEQTAPDRPSFAVLEIGSWIYKLDCGFQPVSQTSFPGVTPLVPTTPAPTVTVPPSTVCNACTSTTTGGCTSNCTTVTTPTTTPCHCVTPQQSQITVKSSNPGVNTGPTPGATTAPVASPVGTTPVVNTPAPAPTATGTDSGSGTGSGTPGGSTCDTTGCSGNGATPASGPTDTTNSGDLNGVDSSGNSTGTGYVPPPS